VIEGFKEIIPLSNNSVCKTQPTTTFYVQYICKIVDADVASKRQTSLLAACICIFNVLCVFAVSTYSKKTVKLETKLWDLQTRTAADYTLEVKMTEE
jgi:hypothetical protein